MSPREERPGKGRACSPALSPPGSLSASHLLGTAVGQPLPGGSGQSHWNICRGNQEVGGVMGLTEKPALPPMQ